MSKKILICTGIYPPSIGGPAQYAKNLNDIWISQGHKVKVLVFGNFLKYPWGIRHVMFLIYTIPSVLWANYIFSLDPFLTGVLAILTKIFRKKIIFRTGGDFLWEFYVQRTGDRVLLRDFYNTRQSKFSLKEKIIFYLLGWALRNVSAIIWSTEWQKNIFIEPYKLHNQKHFIVENQYGEKEGDGEAVNKEFIGSTRKLVWKNLDVLEEVFEKVRKENPEASLFLGNLPFKELMERMRQSYVVILVSLGDISPNMILDAIRYNRPFICTKEVGIYDRIRSAGIFVDPEKPEEIEKAILEILTPEGYIVAKEKVRSFNFVHTWEEIAQEFLNISNKL